MDGPRLTDLCGRLAARLDDSNPTRCELIDMATVLMLVGGDLVRRTGVSDRSAIESASTLLHWIRDHAQNASIAEIRSYLAAAVDTVACAIEHGGAHGDATSHQSVGQEHTRA